MSNEDLGILFRKILQHENRIEEIEATPELKYVWLKIQKELDENYEKYERICEQNRNKRKWSKWNQYTTWDNKRNNNSELNKTRLEQQLSTDNNSQQQSLDYDSSSKEEERKNIKKEREEKLSPTQLVKAYESNELLVKMIWDSDTVKLRAEYKQRKKNRAYKTIKWFIQWLLECVNTVRFWEPRWDTAKRFEYAINQAEEHERKSLVWNEITENKYQNYKKTLALTQRQNE